MRPVDSIIKSEFEYSDCKAFATTWGYVSASSSIARRLRAFTASCVNSNVLEVSSFCCRRYSRIVSTKFKEWVVGEDGGFKGILAGSESRVILFLVTLRKICHWQSQTNTPPWNDQYPVGA